MPAAFPSTIPFRHPLRRTVSVPAQVIEFVDGSEQRWRTATVLNAFDVQLVLLSWTDVLTVQAWFDTIQGAYDSSWSIVIAGETFTNMTLQADMLDAVEDTRPNLFALSLSMRQTVASSTWPAVSPTYPQIATAIITQLPFTDSQRFLTIHNDLPSGLRYSYPEHDTVKRSWICSYPAITTAEMLVLLQFAVAMGGRYRHFTFRDPQTAVDYPSCRLDVDAVQVQYAGPNECSLALPVKEFGV